MRRDLGADGAHAPIDRLGVKGTVHREDPHGFLVRLSAPIPGWMSFSSYENDGTQAAMAAWLFSDDAPEYVERERAAWQQWLDTLTVPA
jgi:hypothetical protein